MVWGISLSVAGQMPNGVSTHDRAGPMTEQEAIAAYADLYAEYQVLWDAACQAAIDAGAAKPRGAVERAMAGTMAHQGTGYFWQTELAQSRIRAAAPEQARIGATAYVRGRAGNAYTHGLLAAYGPYQPDGG